MLGDSGSFQGYIGWSSHDTTPIDCQCCYFRLVVSFFPDPPPYTVGVVVIDFKAVGLIERRTGTGIGSDLCIDHDAPFRVPEDEVWSPYTSRCSYSGLPESRPALLSQDLLQKGKGMVVSGRPLRGQGWAGLHDVP